MNSGASTMPRKMLAAVESPTAPPTPRVFSSATAKPRTIGGRTHARAESDRDPLPRHGAAVLAHQPRQAQQGRDPGRGLQLLHPRVPGGAGDQPRPTNGILVAITVRNSTLASSGRLAM